MNHRKTHTGQKKYQCAKKIHVIQHLQIQPENNLHQCSYYDKSVAQNNRLIIHPSAPIGKKQKLEKHHSNHTNASMDLQMEGETKYKDQLDDTKAGMKEEQTNIKTHETNHISEPKVGIKGKD
ncbi:unnamed protein product, partial [Meganyctiphanes norvegica]